MGDVMRKESVELTDEQTEQIRGIKDFGEDLWKFLDGIGESRELSLAKTRVEEAVMWATKFVTRKVKS